MVLLLLIVFYMGYKVVEFILNLTNLFFHFNVVKVLNFIEIFILVCKSSTENRIHVTSFAAHY